MKVTYDGPNASVEVHVGDGVYVGATHGVSVELPAAVAKGLLGNGEWKKSDPGADKETA